MMKSCPFLDKEKEVAAEAAEFNKTADSDNQKGVINGVWFEEEYTRRYPNNSLACDVIGFTEQIIMVLTVWKNIIMMN
ncbi:MAG: hypothetical protein ACLUGQ_08530 [Coprococcus sp.]